MVEPMVHILSDGYSHVEDNGKTIRANCTCSVIEGPPHIVVDTMTAWDKENILKGLTSLSLKPDDISYVVATHGHSDHVGNLNLFTAATHIVGTCVSRADVYTVHNFDLGPCHLSKFVEVFATPGHTAEDVSVRVHTRNQGCVIIAGDLFECEEDLADSSLWRSMCIHDQDRQEANRRRVLSEADRVVPGHGPMFTVTERHRQLAGIQ